VGQFLVAEPLLTPRETRRVGQFLVAVVGQFKVAEDR